MTRFARAKGSKASNERREEEATPWHVMRQQLADQLSNYNSQSISNTSYNIKEILNSGADSHKEEVWSDFGEKKSNNKHKLKLPKTNEPIEQHKRKISNSEELDQITRKKSFEVGVPSKNNCKSHKVEGIKNSTKLVKVKKGMLLGPVHAKFSETNTVDSSIPILNCKTTKILFKETLEKNSKAFDEELVVHMNNREHKQKTNHNIAVDSAEVKTMKKKKKKRLNNKNIARPIDNLRTLKHNPHELKNPTKNLTSGFRHIFSEDELLPTTVEVATIVKKRKHVKSDNQNLKHKKSNDSSLELERSIENFPMRRKLNVFKEEQSADGYNSSFKTSEQKYSDNLGTNRKFTKIGNRNVNNNCSINNSYPHYRGQKNFQSIFANGREIQVVPFKGFLVKKEDAEELKRLRKILLAQNIPKEKLETIMRLERRKAEKALAREKKKVCFHCRKFGHNLSDCPEIKDSEFVKTGMCFKCGSLEHSHFECKVTQNQEFRYAVCFVCTEQGHIARQCPLNSQGQYPKGGSCHLCGEVTHLRKDCPKTVEENTSKTVTINMLGNSRLEDISATSDKKQPEKRKKKIVKFK